MISINPHNIDNNNNADICLICHDDLNSCQKYSLPECNHEYHTDCIIQWFRTGNSNCPYCNSKSENDCNDSECYYDRRKIIDSSYKMIKTFSKKEEAPKILKSKIKSIEKILDQIKDIKNDLILIKNEEGTLKDLQKKNSQYRSKLWAKNRLLYTKKNMLVSIVNIVPIIIPKKNKQVTSSL